MLIHIIQATWCLCSSRKLLQISSAQPLTSCTAGVPVYMPQLLFMSFIPSQQWAASQQNHQKKSNYHWLWNSIELNWRRLDFIAIAAYRIISSVVKIKIFLLVCIHATRGPTLLHIWLFEGSLQSKYHLNCLQLKMYFISAYSLAFSSLNVS